MSAIQLDSSDAQYSESYRFHSGQCFILFLFPVTIETVKYHLQLNWILLVLLMGTFYMSQATFVQNLYRKLEPGQNITGQIGAEHKGISHIECSTL